MHALVVVAHPDPGSLSHGIAAQVTEGVSLSTPGASAELADLVAERFDPRFGMADLAAYRLEAPPPPDVVAEQARIDRADALVLVYPVYWWSMPGLLKGWIDRVFTNGWAFDYSEDTGLVKKLRRLRVHLVAVAGADARTYERHGYLGAMRTQIDHGIFDYCGAHVVRSEPLFDSGGQDQAAHLATARVLGRTLFDTSERAEVTDKADFYA